MFLYFLYFFCIFCPCCPFLLLLFFSLLFCCCLFTHEPSKRSVGLQMDFFFFSFSSTPPTFCSYPAEKSSSFVPTQPRKAQVFVSWGGVGLWLCMPSCLSYTEFFFTPFFTVQYSTVTLHNRFSSLDARALQSGLRRFCEFFRGGAGEEEERRTLWF